MGLESKFYHDQSRDGGVDVVTFDKIRPGTCGKVAYSAKRYATQLEYRQCGDLFWDNDE